MTQPSAPASNGADRSPTTAATARMAQHRETMKQRGFKLLQTHVPKDVDTFLAAEKTLRRVSSKGDAIAALVAEVKAYRQREEEGQLAG